MDIGQIPLFAMLRGKLGYLSETQRLIAQNVANAETPGYRPQDMKPFNFQAMMQAGQSGVTMTTSSDRDLVSLRDLKRAPKIGMFPSPGIFE